MAYILFTALSTVPKYRFIDIYDRLLLTQHHIIIKLTVMLIGYLLILSSIPRLHDNIYGIYDVAYFRF